MRHGWKTRSSFPYKGLSTDQLVKLGTISLFFYGGTNTSIFCSCFYSMVLPPAPPPPSTGELMYWFFFHLACEKKQLFQLFHFNVILHFTIYLFPLLCSHQPVVRKKHFISDCEEEEDEMRVETDIETLVLEGLSVCSGTRWWAGVNRGSISVYCLTVESVFYDILLNLSKS